MLQPLRVIVNKCRLSLTTYKFLSIVRSSISHDFAI
jgi:hypothetical protein